MRGVTLKNEKRLALKLFQLTRLMRGVTEMDLNRILDIDDFNSHASCEA